MRVYSTTCWKVAARVLAEVGYIGQIGTLFSDFDTVLGDLYYSQYFNKGKTGLIVGRYDPNDFFDVLAYANPWTTFQNLSILFNTSIALPDWSTGIGIGHWYNDQWYVGAFASDANGVATESEFRFDMDELYKTVEISWSPSRNQRYLKNFHITDWSVDEREKEGIDDAHGIALGANWTWDERFMLFSKIGFSDADVANDPQIHEESYTLGGIYYFKGRSDMLGLATNYGELAAEELGAQTATELFYRLQFAKILAITFSMQWLENSALNDQNDNVQIFGMRMRLTL